MRTGCQYLLDELADDVCAVMDEGEPLREAVSDVTERAVVRHEAEASPAAEPPDMPPAPPVEVYQDLEWEYEPD